MQRCANCSWWKGDAAGCLRWPSWVERLPDDWCEAWSPRVPPKPTLVRVAAAAEPATMDGAERHAA